MTGLAHIEETFKQLRSANHAAFMPFLAAGDPDISTTSDLILAMQRSGADLVELGVPYSDPLADGPVIQDSFSRSLAAGLHVRDVIAAIAKARSAGATLPILTMISYSLVFRYGPQRYVKDVADAGADGLIVPDLAVEESDSLRSLCASSGLALVFLVTPATPPDRERLLLDASTGFIYCVSVVGITGERTQLSSTLSAQVRRLRAAKDLPVCVGFGVSTPDQAAKVASLADGVIIGSALVRSIAQDPSNALKSASAFASQLADAVHSTERTNHK